MFVQFTDLMLRVAATLESHGIAPSSSRAGRDRRSGSSCSNVGNGGGDDADDDDDSAAKKKKKRKKAAKSGDDSGGAKGVLLLKMNARTRAARISRSPTTSCSCALCSSDARAVQACRTQAIGRVRRYGQLKTVRVYDFLAEDTIDTRSGPSAHARTAPPRGRGGGV